MMINYIARWEPYDPTKSYEKYTIADAKLNFNKKAPAPVVPKVGGRLLLTCSTTTRKRRPP